MAEHSTIANADTHEPKFITDSVTGDSGKIITANSSVAGTSEFRSIIESDIGSITDIYTLTIDDISTASSGWVVVRNTGTIGRIASVINASIATANTSLVTKIQGVTVTGGGIVVTFAGSAAGDTDAATATDLNAITDGLAIEISSDGASTNTCKAVFTIEVTRT